MTLVIVVKKHGSELTRLEISPGREYVFGRGASCDFVLDNEKGVSRQHLKVREENGQWIVELLSKYGVLTVNGQTVSHAEISDGANFAVPPYDFDVTNAQEHTSAVPHGETIFEEPIDGQEDFIAHDDNSSEEPQSFEQVPQDFEQQVDDFSGTSGSIKLQNGSDQHDSGDTDAAFPAGDDGATRVASPNIVPFLKVQARHGEPEEIFKLEGNLWLAGRDPSCEIFINHPHISRRHFELVSTQDGYFVTDMGSSNGTKVNGKKIKPNQPHPIESGDTLTIRSIVISFEIRNLQFEIMLEEAQKMPVPVGQGGHPPAGGGGALAPIGHGSPNAMRIPDDPNMWRAPDDVKNDSSKKLKLRLLIGAIVLLLIYFTMDDSEPPTRKPSCAPGATDCADNSSTVITEEQKKSLQDFLRVAQDHLDKDKYLLCIAQVEKIHQILPAYGNSQEVETLCRQAQAIYEEELANTRRLRELEKTAADAQVIVERCDNAVATNSKITIDEVNACLSELEVLDPENPNIDRIRNIVAAKVQIETNRKSSAQQRARRVQSGIAKFNSCKQAHASKNFKRAFSVCQQYLNNGYPDQGSRKSQARKYLAAARSGKSDQVKALLQGCQQKFTEKQYKEAIKQCNSAAKVSGPKSEAAKLSRKIASTLEKEMKNIYQDATVEESFGNVSPALQKYKEIVEKDIPTGVYYKKSKSKLKKYGEF